MSLAFIVRTLTPIAMAAMIAVNGVLLGMHWHWSSCVAMGVCFAALIYNRYVCWDVDRRRR